MFGACRLWREQNLRHKTLPLWYVRKNTVYLNVNVRMGWYINCYQKSFYITDEIGAIYRHAIEMRSQQQHTRIMGYGGVTNVKLRSKNQLLQEQPHARRVVGCCCWGAGLLLGGRIVAWCPVQKEGNVRVPSSRKPDLHPILTCVHGDRGCGNPIPTSPGICLISAPGQKV